MNNIIVDWKIVKVSLHLALIYFIMGTPLFAAPTINEVNGTIANGQVITIVGTGFGSGPNVVLFDDFEKGSHGSNIKTGPGSSQVGQWESIEGVSIPKYSNLNKVSGSLAFRADMSSYWRELVKADLPANTTKVFMSWWILIPPGTILPGSGDPDGINWKNVWIQGAGTTDNDLALPTFLGTNTFAITGNDTLYGKWITLNFNIGTWKRVWCYLNGASSSMGQIHYWELTNSGVIQRVNDDNVSVLKTGGTFQQVCINGYGRETYNCYPTFDDIYIATGNNARARIEIGNSAVYSNCSKLTIATPDLWSNNNITARVWQGQFNSSDQAYLFVVDSNGNISPGYLIRFGSGSVADTMPPASPTGMSIMVTQ